MKNIAMERTTIHHREIKKWAEKYGGKPQIIDFPNAQSDLVGIRINFPGRADQVYFDESNPPRDITWREFFREFERQRLTFIYNDSEKITSPSDYYRFAKRQK
jgi:hypothetical protein